MTPEPEIEHISGPEAFQRAYSVSRETLTKLEVYADLLRRWQNTVNLVAPSTLDDLWHRHIADSAQLWGFFRFSPWGEAGQRPDEGGVHGATTVHSVTHASSLTHDSPLTPTLSPGGEGA